MSQKALFYWSTCSTCTQLASSSYISGAGSCVKASVLPTQQVVLVLLGGCSASHPPVILACVL
jgi:hypothetical protein